jgi:hypothetical protein
VTPRGGLECLTAAHLVFAISGSGYAGDADVAVSIGRKDLSFRESRCAAAAAPARIGRRANFESRCMHAEGQRPELRGKHVPRRRSVSGLRTPRPHDRNGAADAIVRRDQRARESPASPQLGLSRARWVCNGR